MILFDLKTSLEPPVIEALNFNSSKITRDLNNNLENLVVESLNKKTKRYYRELIVNLAPIVIEELSIKAKPTLRSLDNNLENIIVEEISNGLNKSTLRELNNNIEPIILETLPSSKRKRIYRELIKVVTPEDSGLEVLLFPEFITLPASVNREEDNVFLIDKVKLAEQDPVTKDTLLSDPNNWKKIILLYRSTTGVHKTISFDLRKDNPDGVFNPSLTDPNDWELIGATVYGFNAQDNVSMDRLYLINYSYDFSVT